MSNQTKHWLSKKIKDVNERKASSIDPSKYPEETFELFSVPIFPTGIAEIVQGKDIGSTKQIVKPGDVLLCKINPRINRVWVVSEPKGFRQIASSEWIVVRSSVHNDRFLKYFFQEGTFRDLLCSDVSGVGGSLTRAKPKLVNEYEVVVAPLAEQKRIVEKLDEVLAQVDTIKARLDGIPDLLKRFRQSVLAFAVSGKLTEEWRKDNSSEFPDVNTISQELFDDGTTKGNFGNKSARAEAIKDDELQKYKSIYPLIRVGEVSGCIVPNRDKPKTFSGDTPWILTPYLNDQSIELRSEQIELGLSSSEIELYNARVIPSDSVIMTCVGRLGLSAVNEFKCVINQQLHAFTCGKHIYSRYLAFSIRAMENYFCSAATSTTVQYLNKTACNSMPLPLPSIEEQKEIVRLVDQYFAFADTIEAQVKKAQARVDNLTQSILAKAFRGELVAQDPNDEPADKLLERIAEARKEAEALAKAAKKAEAAKKRAAKKAAENS
ncbi:restriction endonuclease subunit S [Vibrio campbellii]|uniref:restriction endonuclease subunit S n=1 Tax=Vibrio campbellii TaxID=680 RepID=UPI003AAB789D